MMIENTTKDRYKGAYEFVDEVHTGHLSRAEKAALAAQLVVAESLRDVAYELNEVRESIARRP